MKDTAVVVDDHPQLLLCSQRLLSRSVHLTLQKTIMVASRSCSPILEDESSSNLFIPNKMTDTRYWADETGSSRPHLPLRGMEMSVPPSLNPPSPGSIAVYEAKPLPPVPPRRSIASSFGSEVSRALKTPNRSVDSQQTNYDWEREGADIVAILDRKVPRGRVVPKIDVNNIPNTPPDEMLSPQPKQSIQKILRLTSQKSPVTSLSPGSPSLHNSSQKIRQLTGLDIGADETYYMVSPVSASSSIYSQDNLEATISEPDLDTHTEDISYFHAKKHLLYHDGSSQLFTSAPASLDYPTDNLRYSDPVRSPVDFTAEGFENYRLRESMSPRKSKGRQLDLYHETAAELAQSSQAQSRNVSWVAGYTAVDGTIEEEAPPFSTPLRMESSFASRVQGLKSNIPAPLQIRKASKGDFGTGNHPKRTPYPTKSTFDDEETGESRMSMLSLARVFKRHSAEASSVFSDKGGGSSRSRKLDGVATPSPPASVLQRTNNGIQELVSQAKKTAGMMSRTERRRESLKNKIRVITDDGTPSQPTNKGRSSWM